MKFPSVFKLAALFLLAGSLLYAAAKAPKTVFKSGPQRVSLLELYTSEGCSSCPPADNWMNGLKTNPGLWKDFVPAALHVTVWDYIGWKDPYATEEFTARQRRYASFWRSERIYTPAFFLNGREWDGWIKDASVLPGHGESGILKAEISGGRKISVSFNLKGKEEGSWQVHAVLMGFGLNSKPTVGENAGEDLVHDFTALSYAASKMRVKSHSKYIAELTLPEPSLQAAKYAVAIWLTLGKDPSPVQVVGGYLP